MLPRLVPALTLATLLLAGCTTGFQDATGQVNNDWVLDMVNVRQLHDQGLTGATVKLAVLDTGLRADHVEFQGVRIQWLDLVNGRSKPYDDNGHGTHVAGIIASQGSAGALGPRVQGIAPGIELIAVKVIGADGEGKTSTVARGIDRAVGAGADVIVLSLGGSPGFVVFGTEAEDSVREAIDRGVVVVASAGNKDSDEDDCTVLSPASLRGVIAVNAVDRDRSIASFSCRGQNQGTTPLGLNRAEDPHKKPEVVAPGVQVPGPWNGGPCANVPQSDYCFLSGTSQSAPVVGGIVALLLQQEAGLDSREDVTRMKRAITASAQPVGGASPTDHDDRYGYGLVDAAGALSRWT